MTEEMLEKIGRLSAEKKMWENKLREMTDIRAISFENKGGHSNTPSSPVSQYVEQKENIVENIEKKIAEIGKMELEVLEWIDKIDPVKDSQIRQIILLKFVELKTWQQVANEMKGNTADSVRMMYNRWKEKNL